MKPRTDTYQVNYGSDSINSASANSEFDNQRWQSRKSLLSLFHRSRSSRRLFLMLGGSALVVTLIVGLSVGLTRNSKRDDDGYIKTALPREAGQTQWPETMVSSAVFNQSAVSSDSRVCSEIGSYFLRRNGSAVDAAIATMLCAGLYAPHSMGIGGGFFMIVYNRQSQNASVIDARETAPKAATVDMYHKNPNQSKDGPLSVAIPGELHGLALAHRLYGRTPWPQLLQPIIELCYRGTKVTASMAHALKETRDKLLEDPGSKEIFFHPNSTEVLSEGDVIKRPTLGRTFEVLSQNGVDAFYHGKLGQDLIEELQQMGGILTMEDLANYSSRRRDPIVTDLSHGLRVFGLPPPASGAIMANIMLVLDGYNHTQSDPVLFNHRIIESFKFAYSYRAEMGDDDFINMTQLVSDLTSPQVAASIRHRIWDNRTFSDDHYEPMWKHSTKEDHGTSHVSVLAPNGDAVSVTSTINLYFGSGIVSRKTGIILNDEMDDFSSAHQINYFGVQPSRSNYISAGKRPVSSIVATIFTDNSTGDVRLVTGSAGGTRITTATAYVAVKHLMANEDLGQAVHDLRVHHQLHPPLVQYEEGFPTEILEGLKQLGHNVTEGKSKAVVNAIAKVNGTVYAAADERKKGGVSGF